MDSVDPTIGASVDISTVRSLVLSVLDDCRVNSETDICDLILKKYGSIPCSNWKVQVKNVLITECERSESCVWSSLHRNERVFGLVKNIEEWLTFRRSCQPQVRDPIKPQLHIDTTIKEGKLKGFDPENIRVPPGMSKDRAQIIARGLASMNYRRFQGDQLNVDTLLEFPDTKKLNYARDVWNFCRYNVRLIVFNFLLFLRLIPKDDVWIHAIVEAVFGLPLRSYSDNGPLEDSSESCIYVPPGLEKGLVADYILLLKFVKDTPRESRSYSTYFNRTSDKCKAEIYALRLILSYNPSQSQLIQPVLDQHSQD